MQRRQFLSSATGGAAGAFMASLASGPAFAQGAAATPYPEHPISLVIPLPPGGLADTVGRMLIPRMEASLGQPLVPVNRAGAAGALGTTSVANAKADGYTLLFTLSSITTLPEQARVNNQKPPFLLNQLKPVARISTDPMVVLTHADSRIKDIQQLLREAAARPGEITYGSSGIYGTVHVPAEMLAHAAGVKFTHVPYTGGAPLLQALLGKQIDFTLLPRSSAIQQLRGGRIRALAAMDAARWPQLPDVPTVGELGFDVDYLPWTGLFAPEGTPEPVMVKLRGAAASAVRDPGFRAAIQKSEGTVAYADAPELEKFWVSEIKRLNKVITQIGRIE